MASTAARRSPLTRVRSLASIAASVPVPMASPRSAWASAAASLTPSPTIATTRPSDCSRRITSTLSTGRTSAKTSSMPTCAATAFAADTKPAATEVKLVAPTRGEIHRFVTLPGTVRPWQSATLFARVTGYLKSIAVDRGDEVAAGAVLAEIDAPELAADLARAEAEVTQATAMQAKATADLEKAKADAARYRAEIPRAKAELDIARLEFQRAHAAQQKAPDLVVQQTVDTAKARLEMAEATQAAALATVDAAAAAAQAAAAGREVASAMREVALTGVARAGAVAGFRKIVAPFAGTITDRRVDPGAFISPASGGNAAAQNALVTLMDFRTVRLQVLVPEAEAALVHKGQPVKATFDGLPGRAPVEATVSRTAGVLEESSKTILIEADLPNPKGEIRPGMFASVRVGVERPSKPLRSCTRKNAAWGPLLGV